MTKRPRPTIHHLRRTYITRLVREGAPFATVQELAGHANIKTTIDYYTDTTDEDKQAALALLRNYTAS